MFSSFKEKLNNEMTWARKIIYILSWFLICLMVVLLILRYMNGMDKESFWPDVDYWLLFFVLLDLMILNRVTSVSSRLGSNNNGVYSSSDPKPVEGESRSSGVQDEKFAFGLICGLFLLNLLWMVEKIMSKTVPTLDESIFLPNRLNYLALILGLVLLSLNKRPLGFWLKSWFFKFRDPRAFIVLALIFLIITPFLLVFQQELVAEKAANMAYFMLVIGVLGQFVQYMRESRKENKSSS